MSKLRTGLFCLAGAATIAAATAYTPPSASAQAAVCPQFVVLSCVVEKNGFRHDAWTNACFAKEDGITYLHVGACEGPICSQIYAPVCSINPKTGRPHTYANQCLSDVADAVLIHKGKCRPRR
jgi:hypothetical protein